MRYEGNIYSPHIKGDDYILQCTIGCSHNLCTFCFMYKDKKYHVRNLEDILEDINLAKNCYGDIGKVWLADGDALSMPTADLITILDYLYAAFPSLSYVGTYATAASILHKSLAELTELRKHGLWEAHLGLESGDRRVLASIKKGVSPERIVEAARKIKRAGFSLLVTVILGLAGKSPSARNHAINTAHICNEIQPDAIAILTIIVQQGTELFQKMQKGEFEIPGELEILKEMRLMIQNMAMVHTGITSIHPSNYITIENTLPEDKAEILAALTEIIDNNDFSKLHVRKTDNV